MVERSIEEKVILEFDKFRVESSQKNYYISISIRKLIITVKEIMGNEKESQKWIAEHIQPFPNSLFCKINDKFFLGIKGVRLLKKLFAIPKKEEEAYCIAIMQFFANDNNIPTKEYPNWEFFTFDDHIPKKEKKERINKSKLTELYDNVKFGSREDIENALKRI